MVAYGLFVNKDIFDECELSLPNTPEEFLECCRVLKEKGYETPVGANRWWLETFVFAKAYADLYNGCLLYTSSPTRTSAWPGTPPSAGALWSSC